MARTRKPSVNTNPVANQYSAPSERIIEYSSPHGGGLISLLDDEDGGVLRVDCYRHDPGVSIRVGAPSTSEVQKCAKALLDRLDNITTEEFRLGGEHDEREALRRAIEAAERVR